jgi:hypothetical protein
LDFHQLLPAGLPAHCSGHPRRERAR